MKSLQVVKNALKYYRGCPGCVVTREKLVDLPPDQPFIHLCSVEKFGEGKIKLTTITPAQSKAFGEIQHFLEKDWDLPGWMRGELILIAETTPLPPKAKKTTVRDGG